MLVFTLLGYLCFMLLLLQSSQMAIAQLFAAWQKKIYTSSLDVPTKKMLLRSFLLVLMDASPQKTQMAGLAFYNLRILGKRPSLLLMALSNLGAWWVLVLTLIFMNLNAVMLIGACVLPVLLFRNLEWVRRTFTVILMGGLFLVVSESLIRHASSLSAMMGESNWVFWLADGRLPSILGLLLMAIIITLIVQIEFWSVCVALILLFSSVISFNGALAIFAGERVARAALFVWAGRNLNQDCRLISRQEGCVAATGAFIGLFIMLYIREISGLGRSFGISEAQGRLFDYTLALILILFVQFCLQMLLGHFAAKKSVDEFQEIRYFASSWFKDGRLSPAAVEWSRTQITKRIQEIRYHIQVLGTFKEGQIPDHVQARLKREEEELTKLAKQGYPIFSGTWVRWFLQQ